MAASASRSSAEPSPRSVNSGRPRCSAGKRPSSSGLLRRVASGLLDRNVRVRFHEVYNPVYFLGQIGSHGRKSADSPAAASIRNTARVDASLRGCRRAVALDRTSPDLDAGPSECHLRFASSSRSWSFLRGVVAKARRHRGRWRIRPILRPQCRPPRVFHRRSPGRPLRASVPLTAGAGTIRCRRATTSIR